MDIALRTFGPIVLVLVVGLFLRRVEKGILLFFLVGISFQYLENISLGSISALDVVGMGVPAILLSGLFFGRGRIERRLRKNQLSGIFPVTVIGLFLCGVFFPRLLFPSHSPMSLEQQLGVCGKFVNGLVMFVVVSSMFTTEKRVKLLLGCMMASFVVPGSIAVWEIVSGRTRVHGDAGYPMPWAYFHHPGVLAYCAAVLFPITLFFQNVSSGSKRLAWRIGCGAMLILIFFTYRRTVWLGVFAQLVTWFLVLQPGRKRILYGYTSGVVALITFALGVGLSDVLRERLSDIYVFFANIPAVFYDSQYDRLLTGRWGILRTNMTFFFDQPIVNSIFGNGIGGTFYAAWQEGGRGGNHNCYFILLLEFGLIAFLMYMSIFAIIGVKCREGLRSADGFVRQFARFFMTVFVGYLVMAMGTHMFYRMTSGVWYFWGYTGALFGLLRVREPGSSRAQTLGMDSNECATGT